MKLDIEALARDVGISILAGEDDNGNVKQFYEGWPEQVEAFARLIVERCAEVCIAVEAPSGINEAAFSRATAFGIGTEHCSSAIRNLLED